MALARGSPATVHSTVNIALTKTFTLLTDFSDSATDIQFSIEGDAQVPVLRAQLRDVEGNYHAADVNLAERIGNRDGCFCFGTQCA